MTLNKYNQDIYKETYRIEKQKPLHTLTTINLKKKAVNYCQIREMYFFS